MRVLHVIDTPGPGGAEQVMLDLARESNDGVQFISHAVISREGWLSDCLSAAMVSYTVVPTQGTFDLAYLKGLHGVMRTMRADLVHAHFPGPSIYAGAAASARGIPTVATIHGAVDIESIGRLRWLKLQLLRRLTQPVCVSAELRDRLANAIGVEPRSVRHIANGVPITPAKSSHPRVDGAQGTRRIVVGSLGNVRPAKDYDTAIRAVANLVEKHDIEVEYLVAGQQDADRSLWDAHHRLAERLGVGDKVRFLGFVEDTSRFLESLDVFVLCSRSEGHPLAMTQAMAAGLPIVATRCGIEALVVHGEQALLVDVGDHEALALAIRSIGASTTLATALGTSARRLASERYSIERTVRSYQSLYRELAACAYPARV